MSDDKDCDVLLMKYPGAWGLPSLSPGCIQVEEIVGDTLPWPLNYIIPYTQAITVTRQFRGKDVAQLYQEARCVITALNHRAQATDGDFLLGKHPSALDAKAFGILSFIVAAPTAAPVLKDELANSPALLAFLERVATGPFSSTAPSLQETEDKGAWSSAATGATASADAAAAPTPEEKKAWSKSKWWLGGVGALVVGYALLGGNYIDMEYGADDDEEELGEDLEYA